MDDDSVDELPCRLVERSLVQCPECKRYVSIKCMRYTHRCGRTPDIEARVQEDARAAIAAMQKRRRTPTYKGLLRELAEPSSSVMFR